MSIDTEQLRASLTPENKIGEGVYREVYRFGDKAVKVQKPLYTKRYFGIKIFTIPTGQYTRIKFGTPDSNLHEYRNYAFLCSQIPSELKESFAQIHDLVQVDDRSALICELVKNHDGSSARPLDFYSLVRADERAFWERWGDLERFLLGHDLLLTDVRPKNVMVRWRSDGSIIPVLVDYKYLGAQCCLFQPDLLLRSGRVNRVKRRFSRIREQYQHGVRRESSLYRI